MALSTQPYKGARDFYPVDKRFQKWMFSKWREVVESFGYEEYDAPILESTELYAAKTSEEVVSEQTYTFEDRGGRSVTIRTEMTPTVSRMVAAKRQELSYPARWYSIPNFWRYERPQRGRLREFWQLNVDLFGVEGIEADFETIQVADAIMQSFGAKRDMYTIKVNSRKLMNYLFDEHFALNDVQTETLIRLVDRMHKIEHSEFIAKIDAVLTPTQRDSGLTERIVELLKIKSLKELTGKIAAPELLAEVQKLLDLAKQTHISNIEFDISLMRGFDYYSGLVFEVFDNHPENNRSMFGGGRYDALVGLFGVEPVASVGFGMGDVTFQNFLELHQLMPELRSETDVYVALIGDVFEKSQKILSDLRGMGVNLAVDSTGRKMDKQLKSAAKKGIHYVLIIGDKELEDGQFKLKNLETGNEESHSLERIVSMIKDYRKK